MVSVNLGVLHYVLDHIYGACMHRTKLSTPFFSKGWGGPKLQMLEVMVKQLFPIDATRNWPPQLLQPMWKSVWESRNARLREGIFKTTCDEQLLNALPPESHTARVAFLTPKDIPSHKMACVVHLAGDAQYTFSFYHLSSIVVLFLVKKIFFFHAFAHPIIQFCQLWHQTIILEPYEKFWVPANFISGTGDHTFRRRLQLGGPLLKHNIATMVLESPFYGNRRPSLQSGAKLLCVSDLLLLGRVTIDESRSLLHWLESEVGMGKTGICGLSMGGVHAAMVGSLHPTPIATLPFLAPHSAVVAFCEGILKYGTAWEALREDAEEKAALTLEQVRDRLRSVLSLTDVTRFPIPKSPESVIFVAATDDGYIPKHSVLELQKAWPGSEVRWVTGGHVSSFVLHGDAFRKAIVDSLDRLEWR